MQRLRMPSGETPGKMLVPGTLHGRGPYGTPFNVNEMANATPMRRRGYYQIR